MNVAISVDESLESLEWSRYAEKASVVSPSDGNLFFRAKRAQWRRMLADTNENTVPQKIPFLRDTTLVAIVCIISSVLVIY
jgi:hypothetical protein